MYLAFRVARTMADVLAAGREGMAALSSFDARTALPAHLNRTKTSDTLRCQTGMAYVKCGGTTDGLSDSVAV